MIINVKTQKLMCDCNYILCDICNLDDETYDTQSEDYTTHTTQSEDDYCNICNEYIMDICKKCMLPICIECDYFLMKENICTKEDCNYCWRNKVCFNVYHECYCKNCITDKLKLEVHEAHLNNQKQIEQKKKNEESREKFLKFLLKKQLLTLRSDSVLCLKYIKCNIGDPFEIVHRMCEMKFLFDYCNMRAILNNISYYNRGSIARFKMAEDYVLSKTPYPEVWPWQMDKYARIIQNGCFNWLWKPITNDGKIGINCRLAWSVLSQR